MRRTISKIKSGVKASVLLAMVLMLVMPGSAVVPELKTEWRNSTAAITSFQSDYSIELESVSVEPGDINISIEITGEWSTTIDGYSIGFYYNSSLITINAIDQMEFLAGTPFDPANFWAVLSDISANADPPYVTLAVINMLGNKIPGPDSGLIGNLYIDINSSAPEVFTVLDLEDDVGVSTNSVFIVDGGEVVTDTTDSIITIGNPDDPPYAPSNPNPSNGTIDISINTDLSWTGGDPDAGDTVTYDVYFGSSSPPPLEASDLSSTIYNGLSTLDFETTYYWQIVSDDNNGSTTDGPIWSFTTEINNPPNTPGNPNPGDGATGVTIEPDLSWSGGDPDGHAVTYDVYFGSSSPPPLEASDLSSTTYTGLSTLDFATTYYWQIVAEDEYGLITTGPEWGFTTRVNNPPNTPYNPSPGDGATGEVIDTDLSWSGGDPDGDSVTYDVYFGASSPPPLEASDLSSTVYTGLSTLNFATTYYWQIIAEDEYGLITTGPEWSFTTRVNNPPNTPNTPDPFDGAIDIDIYNDISWFGGDPDGDSVTYDVYFGTSSPPPLEASDVSSTTYTGLGTLDFDTMYYWQIVVEDEYGLISNGPEWSFTTRINNLPTTPNTPSPGDGATDVAIDADLSWSGGDPDPGDTVTYDVYFGTSSPPPLEASDLSILTYDPGELIHDTTYYWQIVAEDNHGATTDGPIWEFTTIINNAPYTPSNPNPLDGATSINVETDLSWTGGDPDGHDVTYNLFFGTSPSPPIKAVGLTTSTYDPIGLAFDTTYYWKVLAIDEYGAETEGPVWNFTTQVGVCGDADGNGVVNVSDAVWLINYIFLGWPAPDPLCIGDASGDGLVNISDAVYIINYIFVGGDPPVEDCCG